MQAGHARSQTQARPINVKAGDAQQSGAGLCPTTIFRTRVQRPLLGLTTIANGIPKAYRRQIEGTSRAYRGHSEGILYFPRYFAFRLGAAAAQKKEYF